VTISGSSSPNLVAKRESRDLPSWGSVPLQSSELRLHPLAPSPTAAPSRRSRAVPEPCGVRLSWGSCSHGHFYAGCPFFFRHAPPRGGSCGAKVAKPSPVPSSGFLPLSTVLASSRLARNLLGSAVRRGPRRFAALFHAARVPGASLQSFPFPGSRTHSRGPCAPLRVRVRLPPAQCLQELHGRFRLSSQLFADRTHPEVDP